MTSKSLPAAFFEEFYSKNPDPWGFAKFDYERDKYAATLAALPQPRYASAFEVGCSIGVLTAELAQRCDSLLAIDAAEAPLAGARARIAETPWVEVRRARVPEDWPEPERFDLILLSEVLYYFSREDLAVIAARLRASLLPGGDVVLVHWLPNTSYPLTGDEAATAFIAALGPAFHSVLAKREKLYRLDVLRRS